MDVCLCFTPNGLNPDSPDSGFFLDQKPLFVSAALLLPQPALPLLFVGAAVGCDLLIVKNKDRSLRQLLQFPPVHLCDLFCVSCITATSTGTASSFSELPQAAIF